MCLELFVFTKTISSFKLPNAEQVMCSLVYLFYSWKCILSFELESLPLVGALILLLRILDMELTEGTL